jgi:hypothetical protein
MRTRRSATAWWLQTPYDADESVNSFDALELQRKFNLRLSLYQEIIIVLNCWSHYECKKVKLSPCLTN